MTRHTDEEMIQQLRAALDDMTTAARWLRDRYVEPACAFGQAAHATEECPGCNAARAIKQADRTSAEANRHLLDRYAAGLARPSEGGF